MNQSFMPITQSHEHKVLAANHFKVAFLCSIGKLSNAFEGAVIKEKSIAGKKVGGDPNSHARRFLLYQLSIADEMDHVFPMKWKVSPGLGIFRYRNQKEWIGALAFHCGSLGGAEQD